MKKIYFILDIYLHYKKHATPLAIKREASHVILASETCCIYLRKNKVIFNTLVNMIILKCFKWTVIRCSINLYCHDWFIIVLQKILTLVSHLQLNWKKCLPLSLPLFWYCKIQLEDTILLLHLLCQQYSGMCLVLNF